MKRTHDKPLPFTRVVRCDECDYNIACHTHKTHESALQKHCPQCAARMSMASRSVELDKRFVNRQKEKQTA